MNNSSIINKLDTEDKLDIEEKNINNDLESFDTSFNDVFECAIGVDENINPIEFDEVSEIEDEEVNINNDLEPFEDICECDAEVDESVKEIEDKDENTNNDLNFFDDAYEWDTETGEYVTTEFDENAASQESENISEFNVEENNEVTALTTLKERRLLVAQTIVKKSIYVSIKSFLIAISLSLLNLFM